MKQRMDCRLLWLCLLIVGLTAGDVFGDAAPDPLHKGIRPIRKISRVKLVSEQVDIVLGTERCDFAVTMVFRNRGLVAESMEVGFPTSYASEVRDARVWIDEREQKTRYSLDKEIHQEVFEGKPETRIYQTHWILWDMQFQAQKTCTLNMTYWVKPRENQAYMVTPYTRFRNAIAEHFRGDGRKRPASVTKLLNAMTSRSTGYILQTGSGWAGPIGRAVVNVYHPGLGTGVLRWFQPEHDFRLTDKKLTWEFNRFDPDFDIDIEYNPRLTLAKERALVNRASVQTDRKEALRHLERYLQKIESKFETSPRR